jgi:ATPase subunit of ABC transporter with duplicated ATPase domains
VATLVARGVSHDLGGRAVLRDVSLTVGPDARIGVVGPNGVGKSTLLRILVGALVPDAGTVVRDPPLSTVGYLAQERDDGGAATVRELLARRTGVAGADAELTAAAAGLASGGDAAAERYGRALARFEALGVADLDARADRLLDDLGLGTADADRAPGELSGGQRAKVALAAVELSRFDVTLLDEPTNDLDFAGMDRLQAWIDRLPGGLVVVSHDRAFLERTVDSVLELDEHARTGRLFGGGWAGYRAERATERAHAEEAYGRYDRERERLGARAEQQRNWATAGVRREATAPRDNDRAQRGFRLNRTEKLASKARQTERALESLEQVDKPWEGWQLRFTIEQAGRSGDVVARLSGAVVRRGPFTLGPVDLEIGWGDRLAVTGPNGSGKSTLVAAVLGTVALDRGARWMGPSVVAGVLGQERTGPGVHGEGAPAGAAVGDLLRSFTRATGMSDPEARSLLAKFALGAEQVTRPAASLSPGERTRAELALFQARGVNLLVLDEPTNHLDLPAIEQLESALAGYTGTVLLVSHDRRLLESFATTRRLALADGRVVTDEPT